MEPADKCNGIVNCPGGTDELLEDCRKYFAPTADIECIKPNIGNNETITILATKCNGVTECLHGEDELDCPNTTKITMISIFICVLIFFTISCTTICCMTFEKAGNLPTLESLNIKELIHLGTIHQDTDKGKQVWKELYQQLLQRHNGSHAETMNYLKVT